MSRTDLAAGCIGLKNRYGWLDRPTGTIEYGTNDSPDIGADTMLENASEKGAIAKAYSTEIYREQAGGL